MKIVTCILIVFFSLTARSQGGPIDRSFDVGSGIEILNSIESISVQADQKVILGGEFQTFNGYPANNIVRLNSDGSIDSSFIIGNGFDNFVTKVFNQPNGKILVYGIYTSYNNQPCNKFLRLNIDGSIDSTFQLDTIIAQFLNDASNSPKFLIQPDNKTIVSYYFNDIHRLNENGSIDSTFQLDSVLLNMGFTYTMELQTDGKILLSYDESPFLVRINADGSLDTSFNANLGLIEGDGVIYSIKYNPVTNTTIFLNTFGSSIASTQYEIQAVDSIGNLVPNYHFIPNTLNYYSFNNIEIQSDGKAFIIGSFQDDIGSSYKSIVRINTDGTIDTTFFTGFGCNSTIYSTAIQNDDKLIIGSNGSADYNFMDINGVARLSGCATGINNGYVTCDSNFTLNGETFTTTGRYFQYLTNSANCDSVISFYLHLESFATTQLINFFVSPDITNSCAGSLSIDLLGNAPFNASVNNQLPIESSNGTLMNDSFFFSDLCSGVNEIQTISNCGDTLITSFFIPSDLSNYQFINGFSGLPIVDSLGILSLNCEIDYSTIDSVFIDTVWLGMSQINAIWNIIDINGLHKDTVVYNVGINSGIYLLQINLYCPNKALEDYFSATQGININNGLIDFVSLNENNLNEFIEVYPNPSNGSVFITNKGNNTSKVTISSFEGKTVFSSELTENSEKSMLQLDLENGVYLLTIFDDLDQLIFNQRIVVF